MDTSSSSSSSTSFTAADSADGAMGANGSSSSSRVSSTAVVSKAATQRLMSDYKEMMTEPPEGCSAAPASDSNLFVWNASIVGPEETPFEGLVPLLYLLLFVKWK